MEDRRWQKLQNPIFKLQINSKLPIGFVGEFQIRNLKTPWDQGMAGWQDPRPIVFARSNFRIPWQIAAGKQQLCPTGSW